MDLNINWFPGHMQQNLRHLKKIISVIDIILEIVDARIPLSSQNLFLKNYLTDYQNKLHIIVLNKSDLSDETTNLKWQSFFQKNKIPFLWASNKSQCKNGKKFLVTLYALAQPLLIRYRKKQIINPTLKVAIVGMPNVGKSTLINYLKNKKTVAVGNKPGVTKGLQWIKINQHFLLMDTPGILMPKINSEQQALKLVLCHLIRIDIFNPEILWYKIISFLFYNQYQAWIIKIFQLSATAINDNCKTVKTVIIEKWRKKNPHIASDQFFAILLNLIINNNQSRITFEEPNL